MTITAPQHTADATVAMVRRWLDEAAGTPTDGRAAMLARLLEAPQGLSFLTGFVDAVVRPEDAREAARGLRRTVESDHAFLPAYQRAALRVGALASVPLPGLVVGVCRATVRQMVGHLIVDASERRLGGALKRLRSGGDRLNLNLLGEAVLGAQEADRRLARTLALIERPDVDYVSLKVSAAVAPHSAWSVEETAAAIADRLAPLYDAAGRTGTFVNLDMEEYRDLELTLDVFENVLSRPEHLGLTAGIVLQAYLPDALGALHRLQAWSAARVATGGAPIKVRLVKGANLSMERVDAELHGWPLATWGSKEESDAHYKRLVDAALTPESTASVRVGVAGHNLFDIAHALLTAQERGCAEHVDVEMLLGMAAPLARAVAEDAGPIRLYTPVVHPQEFDVALAYLVRRLEEVANPANIVASLHRLGSDPDAFAREEARFRRSLAQTGNDARSGVGAAFPVPARHRGEPLPAAVDFRNQPDSDPAVVEQRRAGRAALARSRASSLGVAALTEHWVETEDGVRAEVAAAKAGAAGWQARGPEGRARVLEQVADRLEARRGDLLEVMAAEAGKTLDQADPEVSEAVDFARYYAARARELATYQGARQVPRDVTLVTPPWNFPVAIPAGSAMAALAAGSAVVFKPAEQSPRCGSLVAEILWEAGVPRDALRLVHLDPEATGAALVSHPDVEQIVLTGGYETASLFHRIRPGVRLLAETSGKNALIVTPSADLDLAARDLAQSAFGHAGQKCSAASLAILVGPVARSRRFLTQLEDAVRSMRVGPASDPRTQVGPIIEPARGKLERALTTLEDGEEWLVEPALLDGDRLWSPGVRRGVRPGSWFHLTECFGPVLGLMEAATLDEAIALANAVDYGLTAGIHALDADEIARWTDTIEAGNLYVNRGITGAIVQRQPFGGWKRSVVGPAAKAGGPAALLALTGWERADDAGETGAPGSGGAWGRALDPRVEALVAGAAPWVRTAAERDAACWEERFAPRDRSSMAAERDVLRHVPAPTEIRWDGHDADALLRAAAARVRAGGVGGVSCGQEPPAVVREALDAAGLVVTVETVDAMTARLRGTLGARVRAVGEAVAQSVDLAVYDQPVTGAAEVELPPFLHEQAVAVTAHRYGTPWAVADAVVEGLG
ncbi:proline dehydrogenase family protein [Demequina pelophila]|uniref:proline dehydrogenase family protein n=1 Tax=Demequina pelophila TaxID=1638984 RepID=UPI000784A21C|nr:proline dehydrogenase family protein [Demequina pelophila]